MVSRPTWRARGPCPGARLRLVPNFVDTAASCRRPPAADRRAPLVADFTRPPSGSRAVPDRRVMPGLASRPAARLRLVGRGLTLPPGVDACVEAVGFVDDLDAQYAASACVVVPLLMRGSPLKSSRAWPMACAPCCDAAGRAGLDVTAGVHFAEGEAPMDSPPRCPRAHRRRTRHRGRGARHRRAPVPRSRRSRPFWPRPSTVSISPMRDSHECEAGRRSARPRARGRVGRHAAPRARRPSRRRVGRDADLRHAGERRQRRRHDRQAGGQVLVDLHREDAARLAVDA